MEQEEALIQQHRRLVFSIVNQFKWAIRRGQAEYENLVSEGTIGLIKAIRGYDPEQYGTTFASYATPYVRGSIQNYLTRKAPFMKVHRPTYALGGMILRKQLSDASPFEISHALDCTPQEAQDALRYIRESVVVSLENPIDDDGNTVLERVGQMTDFSQADMAEFLESLKPRQRDIVQLRMEGFSQQEIADTLHLSQMTVCRTLQKVGTKLQAFWGFQIAR